MAFFSRPRTMETGVLYDIGSGSVTCALVTYSWRNAPRIVYASRQRIRLTERSSYRTRIDALQDALTRSVENIVNEGIKKVKALPVGAREIHRADAVYSTPWIAARTKSTTIQKKRPFMLNERLLENLMREEKGAFEQTLDTIPLFEDHHAIAAEQEIVETRLNGYLTNDPLQKRVHTADITLHISFVLKTIAERINRATETSFNVENVTHHTFPYMARRVINAIDTNTPDYFLIHVTGEETSVTRVSASSISRTETFPCGTNAFIRAISQSLGVSFDVAYSYVRILYENRAESATAENIRDAIESPRIKWQMDVGSVLEDISSDGGSRAPVYFMSERYVTPFFIETLTDTSDESGAQRPPYDVIDFSQERFSNIATFDQPTRINHSIATGAYAINTTYEDDTV